MMRFPLKAVKKLSNPDLLVDIIGAGFGAETIAPAQAH